MNAPLLESVADQFNALPPDAVSAARRAALDALLADGMPHPRSERWRYTSLRPLERRRFAASTQPIGFDPALVARIPSPRLVFVNGRYSNELSRLEALPAGVTATPLHAALAAGDGIATLQLARRFERDDEPFARMNAALAADGAIVRVAAHAGGDQPVHLVFIGVPDHGDVAWHTRTLIDVGAGARLTLVEHQLGPIAHRGLANAIVEIAVQPGARLRHVRVQNDGDGALSMLRTDAVVHANAEYRRLDLELGAALSRHELNIALQGEGARLVANGVLLATARRHVDTRLGIDHQVRDTACELGWRGLASGRGRAAFHGGILIRAGADGASAQLANKNLLLSADAEIDTQPVLEIHADEVKAAHGATVGRLDPTALFYLRSRGLSSVEARRLLTLAFCRETLAALDDQKLADALAPELDAALQGLEMPA